MPPPLPVTLATPTTSGITKAEVNTGPINPTDWAITSGNDNTLAPRRPLSGWGFSMISTISFLSSLRVVQVISARDYGKTQDGITMKSGCARVISAWHPCQAEILPFAPD